MPSVNLIDPASGKVFAVDEADASNLVREGWRLEAGAEAAARVTNEQRTEEYSSLANKARAGIAAVGRGVTVGASDAIASSLGYGEELANLRDYNPGISFGGELLGAVSGVGLAGRAAKIGKGIAEAGEGASLATRVLRSGAGYGTEGALQGIGSGVSELALSDDPLTIERIGSTLSSHMLLGGAIGAGSGALGKLAERGIARAKGALDNAAGRLGQTGGEIADDLAQLDAKGLRAAEDAEREILAKAQVTQRGAAADEIATYHRTLRDANPWAVVEGEASAELAKANANLRRSLGNKAGLAENPARAMDALQRTEQALQSTIDNATEVAEKLAARNAKFATKIEAEIATAKGDEIALSGPLGRRFAAFDGVKAPRTGEVVANKARAGEFLEALRNGTIKGSEDAALAKLPELLDANRSLQQRIRSSMAPKAELTSERLAQIADAKDALSAGGRGGRGVGEQLVQGSTFGAVTGALSAIPVIGQVPGLASLIGAKASNAIAEILSGRFGKVAAGVAERSSKAVSTFLDVATKVAPKVPVLATKILGEVRYARSRDDDSSSTKSLGAVFKARAAELRSQTEYSPAGVPVMREAARMQMETQLDPIRAVSPLLADRLGQLAARRVEFLASKLPRRPDIEGIQFGPDTWKTNEMEMRQFARYAAAVEDPGGVEERLASGKVVPEEAEAYRAVYPERYAAIVADILTELPTLRKKLPYSRRLALSIFSGVAVDPSMDPAVLRVLQSGFEEEPGTEGGMQPPTAQPQFGSVKAEEPTPAQERAG